MNRSFFAAVLISILSSPVTQTMASEAEYVQWQSLRIECMELEPIGKVILTAQVNEGKFGSLEVTVFGRTHTLEPEKLAKLEGFPLSSVSITHEAGYKKLGGYTLTCKFNRVYYNDDKDLIQELAYISFFKDKPKEVSVIIQSKTINKDSEQTNSTESKENKEVTKPINMTNDDVKIVIKKGPALDAGPNTFIGNPSIKDGDSLLSWLGGKSEIDKILIGTPYINANQQQFSESYVRKRFEKSVCVNSQSDKWHYAPYTMGTIYMKNGEQINFEMYLSGIKVGKILFALP